MSGNVSVAKAAGDGAGVIRWGILGPGAIAKAFARGVAAAGNGQIVAVGSRTRANADAFAAEFCPGATCYGGYQALLDDPNVQAVYIAVPHPMHAEWTIKAAEAKKHVLVEKPIALDHADAMAMIEAAVVNDVFLMEAFMYRCHPQTARLVELVRDKAIGEVRLIQATFSFHAGFNAEGRIFNNDLGGGGILDVGCYPVSIARLVAGAATGKPFADPTHVSGAAHLGETGVDEWSAGTLKFPGDIIAQVATGVALAQDNTVRIYGSEGNIVVPNAWVAAREGGTSARIIVHRKGVKEPREIVTETPVTSFAMEIKLAGEAILAGRKQVASPAMTWDDSLGNIRTLDRWREAIGLTYRQETPAGYRTTTVAGRPLAVRPTNVTSGMTYGEVPGLSKKISRLIMGCDNQTSFAHAAVMFDDWFERGGNAFDTSFIYGGGRPETLLGAWMKHRGVREQCVVIVKGLHNPDTYPHRLEFELPKSLERLKTDYADLYIMHRDNPQVPVGEFVEAINRHIEAGRIKAWGGSNWSLARVDEAVAYARQHGLVPPVAVSNNFSLARMVDPVWGGCISASDPESRAWFARTQTALFSWSSQARGFFLPGRAAPEKKDDAELVRCWYSEDNFRRLARATELAAKKGVSPINIALAYVLNQPFPTFALIGPRLLSEIRTSLPGLDVALTPDEVKWLNLEG